MLETFRLFINHVAVYQSVVFLLAISIIFVILRTMCILFEGRADIKKQIICTLIISLILQLPLLIINHTTEPPIRKYISTIFIMPPIYLYFIVYGLFYFVIKISRYKIIDITFKTYMLLVVTTVIYFMIDLAVFNYMPQFLSKYEKAIITSFISLIINVGICHVLRHNLKRNQFWAQYQYWDISIVQKNQKRSKANFLWSLVVWILSLSLLAIVLFIANTVQDLICLSCVLCLYVLLFSKSVLDNLTSIQQSALLNKNIHIDTMLTTINGLQQTMEDIQETLINYDTSIISSNYESILSQQASASNTIKTEKVNQSIVSKMHENPAFYSMVISKINNVGANINFTLLFDANISNINISFLTLARISGILLDNAIEETMQHNDKNIVIKTHSDSLDNVTIEITNPCTPPIDLDKIFSKGYTTKVGHTGLGLYEVVSVLKSIEGADFKTIQKDNTMSVILSIPKRKTL